MGLPAVVVAVPAERRGGGKPQQVHLGETVDGGQPAIEASTVLDDEREHPALVLGELIGPAGIEAGHHEVADAIIGHSEYR